MQVIGLFLLLFTLCVLSFQTWTINRYVLPLLPFVYLFTALGVTRLQYKPVFVSLIIIVSLVSLSRSIDPVSNYLWPKREVLGEQIYLHEHLNGGDGVTYNIQYLKMMKERTSMIINGNCDIPAIIEYNTTTLSLLNISNCRQ